MKHNPFQLQQVSVRLVKETPIYSKEQIKNPEDAVRLLSDVFKEYDREIVCVVNLRANLSPINMCICSVGVLDKALAHPREILKSVYLSNAHSIILIHNHPTGSLVPSEDDIVLTDKIHKVCMVADIPLVDHIIVGGENEYFSFKKKGILPISRNEKSPSLDDIDLSSTYNNKKRRDKNVEVKVKTNQINNPENSVKGIATVSFGDQFKVRSIAVMEGKEGKYFVSMPSYKTKQTDKDGKAVYKDICNPITKEFRDQLYGAVLESFESGKEVCIEVAEGRDKLSFNVSAAALPETGGNTKGVARIYLEDAFVINNVTVKESRAGELFMSMPSYKSSQVGDDGKAVYKDVCYPATKEFRDTIQKEVLAVYQESVEIQREAAESESPFVEGKEVKNNVPSSRKKEETGQKKPSIKEKIAQGEEKKKEVKKEKVNKTKAEERG